MKWRWLTLVPVCLVVLWSCTTTPRYTPATGPESAGYSDTKIEEDRYRVEFRGGNDATARDFALLRAAEVTLANGYDWFQVVQESTDAEAGESGPRVSVGGGVGSWGGRTSSGVGLGVGFPIGGAARESAHALEIVLGAGPKPADPNAYDAESVASSLRARLMTDS